jgi:molybdopterin molybdotransferase
VLTVEEYQAELLALVAPDHRTEVVPLSEAAGRVLAADLTSTVSIPVFDNSAMDGYAVRFADVAEVPARLRVVAEVPAGSAANPSAGPGECVGIMTGAALPGFADTVVPVEDTDGGTTVVTVRARPARKGAFVRPAGDDVAAGHRVLVAGTRLGPAQLGVAAGVGATEVRVRPRPVVAVCATGDELVVDGSPLQRGQIYESNSVVLAAAVARDGGEPRRADPVRDSPEALAAWLGSVRADLVVLTGGASVGAYDVVRDVLQGAGGRFRTVRVQPGKPQGWAMWDGIPVVALPGNPLSASLSYEVFVRPMLERVLGLPAQPWVTAVAAASWATPVGRRQLLPVRLAGDGQGRLTAVPAHPRGSASHTLTSLAEADGYAAVPEDVPAVAPGDLLSVRWL